MTTRQLTTMRRLTTSSGRRRHRHLRGGLGLLAGCAAAALTLAACGGAVVNGAAPPPKTHISAPLPTSLTTSTGTWASVPMGHLSHPLNTFWQLFFLPAQGGSWQDHAGQLGIADNGGLLLASPGASSLVVAAPPSNFLKFSAMAVTTADGRSWTPGPALQGAAASLAVAARGPEFAVVRDTSGGKVAAASAGSSSWHTEVTARALGATPAGRSCAPIHLTAVAAGPSGTPLVGARCGQKGVAGVFADEGGQWQSVGPQVSASGAQVAVLSLRTAGGSPSALFSLTTRSGTRIVAGWADANGSWRLSSRLSLGAHGRLASIGPAPDDGAFVLSRQGSGAERLAVVRGPGTSWTSLPAPPKGTATVAFPSAGRVDALAVHDSLMTDWVLTTGSPAWTKRQHVKVTIIYGSST